MYVFRLRSILEKSDVLGAFLELKEEFYFYSFSFSSLFVNKGYRILDLEERSKEICDCNLSVHSSNISMNSYYYLVVMNYLAMSE